MVDKIVIGANGEPEPGPGQRLAPCGEDQVEVNGACWWNIRASPKTCPYVKYKGMCLTPAHHDKQPDKPIAAPKEKK